MCVWIPKCSEASQRLVSAIAAIFLFSPCFAAERFQLAVPGNSAVKSTAIVDSDKLVIVDGAGNRFEYLRQTRLDSPNSEFFGFYCEAARQYLRWPKSGTGAMYIGTAEGRSVSWKKSRMQLHRSGTKPSAAGPTGRAITSVGPMHVDAIAEHAGRVTVAHIDDRGQIQFFRGKAGRWEPHKPVLAEALVAGAPIKLGADRLSDLPLVYTVNDRGELIEVRDGARVRVIVDKSTATFAPQSYLALTTRGGESFIVITDRRGRIWEVDIQRGRHQLIERREGLFSAGIPIAYVKDKSDQLYLVDRAGSLGRYELRGGIWSAPTAIAAGFSPGSHLSARSFGAPTSVVHVAAVDATGNLRLLRRDGRRWSDERVGRSLLPPGTPVSLSGVGDTLSITGIQSNGGWREWFRKVGGHWEHRDIARGFPTGAPVRLQPDGPYGFAVDRTGRLIAGQLVGENWHCAVCSPLFDLAPRLVRRAITPNEPLQSVNVLLSNQHKENLVVRLVDARTPDQPIEIKLAPGKSKSQRIDRDSGATLEEVYLVPSPRGGLVEEVHRHRLPPQRFYDVVVYADRVTSVFFDRTKNKTDIPDEQSKSLVSIGVFPIPAGDRLQDGDEIDVYQQASRWKNPGAVRLFDR